MAVITHDAGRHGRIRNVQVLDGHEPEHIILLDIDDINASVGLPHIAELFQPKLQYSATYAAFRFRRCSSGIDAHNETSSTFVPLEGFAPPDLVAFTVKLESKLALLKPDDSVPVDDSVCGEALLETLGRAAREQYRSSGMYVRKVEVNLTICCEMRE